MWRSSWMTVVWGRVHDVCMLYMRSDKTDVAEYGTGEAEIHRWEHESVERCKQERGAACAQLTDATATGP